MGDSREAAINYFNSGVDEILYIDSVASLYGRNSLTEILKSTAKSIFIPITAGGGVRNIEDAARLLAAGADKIAVNTACIQNPKLINQLAKEFGSQCIVVSIQARAKPSSQEWECMTEAGRERSDVSVIDWIQKVQELGAGEILLTSVDQDGTCKGPDKKLINAAADVAEVPLIVGGGISTVEEIEDSFRKTIITGVSLAASLHHRKIEVKEIKSRLLSSDFNIRIPASIKREELKEKLSDINVGIIDYGMGNQQSLINAFTEIGLSTCLTSSVEKLTKTDLLALPGVGSFPKGMEMLKELDLIDFLKDRAEKDHPLIGICLGMQMLFESGNEFKHTKGLGLIEGEVEMLSVSLKPDTINVLPHVGWNKIYKHNEAENSCEKSFNQYFVHSYAAIDVPKEYITYECNYAGNDFIAAVNKNCISGFQFHPERSGRAGLNLLADEVLRLVRSQ